MTTRSPEVLEALYRILPDAPVPIAELSRRARLAPDQVETALDKLWIHGGAVVDGESARVGRAGWRPLYVRQREHKQEQLDEILRFADSHELPDAAPPASLRRRGGPDTAVRPMRRLRPAGDGGARWRPPTRPESHRLLLVLESLRRRDRLATGQLHREVRARSRSGATSSGCSAASRGAASSA